MIPYAYTCHLCGVKRYRCEMYRVYNNTAGWVRLCCKCAEKRPAGYYFAFDQRRQLGEKIPKGVRA